MSYEVVLISGRQGAGKTTLSKALVHNLELFHRKAVDMTFASILYEMHDAVREVGDKYGIPRVEPKDGPLLQLLGTEWGRAMDQDIWVKALKKKIERLHQEERIEFFIVSDCRFKNEFDAFPDATRLRLECAESIRRERCSMWRENTQHPSEIDLDEYVEEGKFDAVIDTSVTPVNDIVDIFIKGLK